MSARPRNPQAEQMADESMVRNLADQATAIWPQERPLFERYALAGRLRVADVGCGSGEITARLADLYPEAEIVGVDILEGPLAYARARYPGLAGRVRFVQGDAFALDLPADAFDLVVCRHLTQAVPEPERVLAELVRIAKPGGWLHVLSEDYGMLHMTAGALDPDRLWHGAGCAYARAIGTDDHVGRRTWSMLNALGLRDLTVDYAVVDTVRVPRATFAGIIAAWRDGYADVIADKAGFPRAEVKALFDQIVSSILDPTQYAVWQVPILGGRKPS